MACGSGHKLPPQKHEHLYICFAILQNCLSAQIPIKKILKLKIKFP